MSYTIPIYWGCPNISEFFNTKGIIFFDTKEQLNTIINHFGNNSKNSFTYLGIKENDYIQIQNSDQKYKIKSLAVDDEKKEILTIIGNLENSDLKATATLITIYQENKSNINTNIDNIVLGKCEIYSDINVIECISNSTQLQCELRKDDAEKLKTTFTANFSCNPTSITNQIQLLNKLRSRPVITLNSPTIYSNYTRFNS